MAKDASPRAKLLAHFLSNIGKVIASDELAKVAGISEWARRVRELRDEHGYQIQTHNDRADLRPNQYIMISEVRLEATERSISKETRARVLDEYGSVCYSCGAIAAEPHPQSGKPTTLHIGHVIAKSMGGDDSVANLRPICTICNTGASNIAAELPTSKRLIAEIRKAPKAQQLAVWEWLRRKFESK